MNGFKHVSINIDDQKTATVTLDSADRPLNVFDEELLTEMQTVVTQLGAQSDLKLIVFGSGKQSGFLAGADVPHIQSIQSEAIAREALARGQMLFNAIAALNAPTVAVIHGVCLGGGLEFAMSCRYRIALDIASTKLGLPETQLGLIPGWGGTQRLPAIVGLKQAMTMILQGTQLSATEAFKAGLVDALATVENTEADVNDFLEKCRSTSPPKPRSGNLLKWLTDKTWPGQAILFAIARRRLGSRGKHYPALAAALRAMEVGMSQGRDAGLREEQTQFCNILFHPTTRNLLELFSQRERARKVSTWIPATHKSHATIETVAVIGGGTMGAGIAQLALTRGYRVVLRELNSELAVAGGKRVLDLLNAGEKKGAIDTEKANAARNAFTVTTEWPPVCEADLVVEAIVEKLNVKQSLFRDLDERLPERTIFASNTSALSISDMARVTMRSDRIAGLHFFNPVHKMPLVEVVKAHDTAPETLEALLEFTRALGKTPVLVSEGPGFLVNRVLFSYLDEAVRLVLEGTSVSEVDREAKRFGMPMGPLELMDTVGLDIAADVAGTLAVLDNDASPTPECLNGLVRRGIKGQKTSGGFYTYVKGRRADVADLGLTAVSNTSQVSSRRIGDETFSGIQLRLIGSLINAAAQTIQAGIVTEPWMVDLGMVLGTGFPPFRGGPLRLAEFWGHDTVRQILGEFSKTLGPRFEPCEWFANKTSTVGRDSSPVLI